MQCVTCCVHSAVPVNDAPAVEVVKRLHDTAGVEASGGVIEVTTVPEEDQKLQRGLGRDSDDDEDDDDNECELEAYMNNC